MQIYFASLIRRFEMMEVVIGSSFKPTQIIGCRHRTILDTRIHLVVVLHIIRWHPWVRTRSISIIFGTFSQRNPWKTPQRSIATLHFLQMVSTKHSKFMVRYCNNLSFNLVFRLLCCFFFVYHLLLSSVFIISFENIDASSNQNPQNKVTKEWVSQRKKEDTRPILIHPKPQTKEVTTKKSQSVNKEKHTSFNRIQSQRSFRNFSIQKNIRFQTSVKE